VGIAGRLEVTHGLRVGDPCRDETVQLGAGGLRAPRDGDVDVESSTGDELTVDLGHDPVGHGGVGQLLTDERDGCWSTEQADHAEHRARRRVERRQPRRHGRLEGGGLRIAGQRDQRGGVASGTGHDVVDDGRHVVPVEVGGNQRGCLVIGERSEVDAHHARARGEARRQALSARLVVGDGDDEGDLSDE
jgi:hypothetical protein